jgi:hypothetical protein
VGTQQLDLDGVEAQEHPAISNRANTLARALPHSLQSWKDRPQTHQEIVNVSVLIHQLRFERQRVAFFCLLTNSHTSMSLTVSRIEQTASPPTNLQANRVVVAFRLHILHVVALLEIVRLGCTDAKPKDRISQNVLTAISPAASYR